jgi:hypothetical protein
MKINLDKLIAIAITYDNTIVPPPFSFIYQLNINLEKGRTKVDYQLNYTDRNEIDEEEILEEGFTLNDDFQWNGELPDLWQQEVKNFIAQTSWTAYQEEDEEILRFALLQEGSQPISVVPEDIKKTEYFLQELIQAIYEISQKERPLIIRYKEIGPDNDTTFISIQPSFSQRSVRVTQRQNKQQQEKDIPWHSLQYIFEAVYLPEYDYEKATPKEPVKPGKYIDNGEGIWFELGKGLKSPDNKQDALKKIEKILKQI